MKKLENYNDIHRMIAEGFSDSAIKIQVPENTGASVRNYYVSLNKQECLNNHDCFAHWDHNQAP